MPSGTYGGVRGRKTKVGRKLLRFPPTRLCLGLFHLCFFSLLVQHSTPFLHLYIDI